MLRQRLARLVSGRPRVFVLGVVVIAALLTPSVAIGWYGDHFDDGVSGQAVYESMAIHAEAVHRGDVTYVAYQGVDLDPYIVSYNHVTDVWDGPVKVGENQLAEPDQWNPDDSHGAPSLLIDDSGYIHIMYGAHGTKIQRARSTSPWNINSWTNLSTIGSSASYPQLLHKGATDPNHELFYRVDGSSAWYRGGWVRSESSDGGAWSYKEIVVAGDPVTWSWYANFSRGESDRVHAALISQDRFAGDPFVRYDVFYMYRDAADGAWKDVQGSVISTPGMAPPDHSVLTSAGLEAKVYGDFDYQNQVVVADDTEGNPGLLFVSGQGNGPNTYSWMFSRWSGSSWETTEIAKTDHFMDSGALEYESTSTVRAILTREGTRGEGTYSDRYIDRGGDIEVWLSTDGGATWAPDNTTASPSGKVATSDLDTGIIFNDPQVVQSDSPEPEARVLFCEWDNDAGKMVHRIFLWGDDGYREKEFFPGVERIAGGDRYDVSVGLSRESFPLSSDAIFIASGAVFSDALAGVPLADSYNAPILLVGKDHLPAVVAAEIKRLYKPHWKYGYDVVILGGTNTISPEVEAQIKALTPQATVRRIAGSDRYAVSANIAAELKAREGAPDGVFYASGSDDKAGDALSVSPVAAAKGWPVLLTLHEKLTAPVKSFVDSTPGASIYIVGGPASVSQNIYTGGRGSHRLAGYDRYATSAAIGRFALEGGYGEPPALRMSRYALASGEVFSDALPGGVMATRMRGPVFLTQHDQLPSPTRDVLKEKAYRVTTAYVLGGEVTIEPGVVAEMVQILQDRQYVN